MKLWKNDKELFDIARKELFTALVGDVLDKMGYLHQFLSPSIKPLRSDMVTIGRAMPVLEADVFMEKAIGTQNPLMEKPFGIMFELPVLVVWLSRLGLISAKQLAGARKFIILAVFTVAAVLTPPDVVSQCMLAGPLLVLFEISVVCAGIFGKKTED